MPDEMMARAKRGYEAYGAFTGWKAFNGLPMPAWEALPERIRGAWREAAIAIAEDEVLGHGTD